MTTSAIIVAAGSGLRMKNQIRKQYLDLLGLPILARTVRVFAAHPEIAATVVVVPETDLEYCRERVLPHADNGNLVLVAGGAQRQDSVYQGLLNAPEAGIVVIHDGVRPFVRPETISACIRGAAEYGACIAAIPASDTLKHVDDDGIIDKTLSREGVWMAQTPQAFQRDLILAAYANAFRTGASFTDDAAVAAHHGRPVRIIEGSPFNIKITTPADLAFARILVAAQN